MVPEYPIGGLEYNREKNIERIPLFHGVSVLSEGDGINMRKLNHIYSNWWVVWKEIRKDRRSGGLWIYVSGWDDNQSVRED